MSAAGASAATVLVVDDEVDMIATYERLLRRRGHRVVSATSRADGLRTITSEPVALLVADVRLPNLRRRRRASLGIGLKRRPPARRAAHTVAVTVALGGRIYRAIRMPRLRAFSENLRRIERFRRWNGSCSPLSP